VGPKALLPSFFQWVELLVCVNHLLVTINSSFNFLLYLMATSKMTRGDKRLKLFEEQTSALQFSKAGIDPKATN
jgi:hypothetical protein